MLVCPKCKKEHSPECAFCGFCGSSLISAHVIVDGKKNKKQLGFLNKMYSSDLINIFYFAAYFVVLVCLIVFGIYTVTKLISDFPGFEYHIGQIVAKYEYVKEGVGASYISLSLSFVANYILVAVLSLGFIINIPATAFNVAFGSYLLYYKKRKVLQCGVQKPVALVRMKMIVSKTWGIINILLTGILISIIVLKICFI